ncbi:UbiD family decarboxylase, partial [Candidatus Sumerlaeota bacterium]|nr:UbiD family decarboxylase [Candidatus Sumerlaeota bacterium]
MSPDLPARGSFESLRQFIDHLERVGDLVRIRERVSPHLEITEIADRVMKSPGGGKALLFESVEDATMPVAINLFGSRRRMAMTLGTERPADITEEILGILDPGQASSLMDKLKMLPKLKSIADAKPHVVKRGPCQEIIVDPPR